MFSATSFDTQMEGVAIAPRFRNGLVRNITLVCHALKCSSSLHLNLWDIISVVGRSHRGIRLKFEL